MRKVLRGLDALVEFLGIALLGAIVLVVTWAVVARTLFGSEQGWSEQVSVTLMVWVVFLGTAIGFRERSHTSVNVVVEKLSEGAQTWVQRFTYLLVLSFGLFLIVRGLQLTIESEEWALHAALPLSGLMTCVYATLQLVGVRTERSVGEVEGESSTVGLDT